jgi:hypothetical protein
LSIDEVTNGTQVRGVLAECGVDCLREGIGAVGIEDLQEPAGEDA